MYVFKLAYRHENGEIEGFAASAFSQSAAERNALNKVRAKVREIRQTFDESRVIRSDKGLTPDEKKQVRADWRVSDKSDVC